MKTYSYFISYNYWTDEGYGFGNTNINLDEPISNIETIRDMQDKIKSKGKFEGVAINNFILLKEPN